MPLMFCFSDGNRNQELAQSALARFMKVEIRTLINE